MSARSAAHLPALFSFAETESREDGWGRFESLAATGGRLLTRFRLEPGDRVWLSFELRGSAFRRLPAQAGRCLRDADGYFVAELRFTDEVEKLRLQRCLLALLSRSPEEAPR